MRVVVTGAAGSLGRRVVARALLAGHEVVATDLPSVTATADDEAGAIWLGADLTVLEDARRLLAGAAAVVHLAGLTSPRAAEEPEVHRTNVGVTYNVLLAAEERGVAAVCTASSVNAIGGFYSARPHYDYFPLDEVHPSYCEDAYSLSKWVGEQQSAAFARRRPEAVFAALRLHALREDITDAVHPPDTGPEKRLRDLWGWTSFDAAAAAVLRALRRPDPGHAVYNIVAARTTCEIPSSELARRFHPEVPLRCPLPGNAGFYDTTRAAAELGWHAHDEHPAISAAER
ncbi:NAD-dependent epimerase/dehydratase family protein [Pseudonocardia spinosispora]|uniref:NAD-dependent epimerase/dehydratase family protein n=1 Tax=Pseudonocardia spinosispora TaxID=103441 RepID=UPI00146FBE06|nr:NAD(P)-dependent oxidoreductase [Pseudonocardia spinosispora]